MERTIVLIGIVSFGTFFALIFGSAASSYIYNETWLANDNEIPECVMSPAVDVNCSQNYDEYLNGLFWWSSFVGSIILAVGSMFAVIIYKKRPALRTN